MTDCYILILQALREAPDTGLPEAWVRTRLRSAGLSDDAITAGLRTAQDQGYTTFRVEAVTRNKRLYLTPSGEGHLTRLGV